VSCPHLETIAAYTLGELSPDEAERFEAHYFDCDACLAQAERMERLVAALGAALPPVVSPERRRALESAVPHVVTEHLQPGDAGMLRLGGDKHLGFWVMHAELAGAERVDFEARDPAGKPLFLLRDVPFDPARGEVVLACQFHYRAMSEASKMHVSLVATDARGSRPVGEYILDHLFDAV
jgi:anti-sigma factor RsiW